MAFATAAISNLKEPHHAKSTEQLTTATQNQQPDGTDQTPSARTGAPQRNRARCAAAILAVFQRRTGADRADALSDLLADLMHWCDRSGLEFRAALRRARSHYAAETAAASKRPARRSDQG